MSEVSDTSVAIVRQGLPLQERRLAQVLRLLDLRAYADAQRVLRTVSMDLHHLASRLDPS